MIYIDREGGHWGTVDVRSGTRLVSTDWLAPHRPQPNPQHPLRSGMPLCTFTEVNEALGPLETDGDAPSVQNETR